VETKLHTKSLHVENSCGNHKRKQEPHLMWDLLYAYHLLMKGKHKWPLHLFKCILSKIYMCLKLEKLLWFWTNVVWFNVLSWFSSRNHPRFIIMNGQYILILHQQNIKYGARTLVLYHWNKGESFKMTMAS